MTSKAIIIVDATPNVMHLAAQLKDLPYKKGNSAKRRLGTPDAIMLAGCLTFKMSRSEDRFVPYIR